MLKLTQAISLQGWKPILASDVELEDCEGTECPACCPTSRLPLVQLEHAACMIGSSDGRFFDVSACPRCGHVTYRRMPTESWLTSYYDTGWNQDEAAKADQSIAALKEVGYDGGHPIAELAAQVPFNPAMRVLDVGCGNGSALDTMRRKGYRNLVGLESSPHRVRIAREGFGLDARRETVTEHLEQKPQYDIILSHHVLEHVRDPAKMVRQFARMQPKGGYLVLATPNFLGEPTMGVLMFLLHLHSFTKQSMYWMLKRCGYEPIIDCSDKNSLAIVARKAEYCDRSELPSTEQGTLIADHKVRKGLGGSCRGEMFVWNKMYDNGYYMSEMEWVQTAHSLDEPRCFKVEPVECEPLGPIVIEMEGPLVLFVK